MVRSVCDSKCRMQLTISVIAPALLGDPSTLKTGIGQEMVHIAMLHDFTYSESMNLGMEIAIHGDHISSIIRELKAAVIEEQIPESLFLQTLQGLPNYLVMA